MIRLGLIVAVLALGVARDPGCGSVDRTSSGPNAPCTRDKDCRGDLVCARGVCAEPEASDAGDAGDADAGPSIDATDG